MQDLFDYVFYNHSPSEIRAMKKKLLKAIEKLPDDNRTAITCHYIKRMARKEIVKHLGWPLSKVNGKITRGVTLLKWELNPTALAKAREILQQSAERLMAMPMPMSTQNNN